MTKTYVIRAGTLGPLKIGTSKNPEDRLRQLQTASPRQLYLVGLIDQPELVIHDLLAGERIQGEWFHASGRTTDILAHYGIDIAPTPPEAKSPPPSQVTWNDYLELVRMGLANEPAWKPREPVASA